MKALLSMSHSLVQTISDLTMKDNTENPLLLLMSKPDSSYFKALKLFTCTAISTTHYDKIVPFASSAIMLYNPFPKPDPSDTHLIAGASGFDNLHLAELKKYTKEDSFIYKRSYSTEALEDLEEFAEKLKENE